MNLVFFGDAKLRASQFTKEFSQELKKNVPEVVRKSVTGKSLRQAAITLMGTRNDLSEGLVNNRSGHASGSNTKHYNFGTLAGSMPDMKVLAGYNYISQDVVAPRLWVLVPDHLQAAQLDKFLDIL